MSNRTYRIAVILSVFALMGVAAVGAVSAQSLEANNLELNPDPATTAQSPTASVTINETAGPANAVNLTDVALTVTDSGGGTVAVIDNFGGVEGENLSSSSTVASASLGSGLPIDTHTASLSVTGNQSTSANDNYQFNITPTTNIPGERELNRPVSAGDGTVVLGPSGNRPTVFQGESSIAFYNPDTNSFVDTLTSTDDENRVIDVPIGTNEQPGTYTISGDPGTDGVIVQEPEVTSLEIINVNGEEVSSVTQGNNILVGVDYNYEKAAPLVVKIKDDQGVSVEGQYLLHKPPKDGDRDDLSNNQEDKLNSSGYDRFAVANFDDSGSYNVIAKPKGYDNDGELDDVGSSINKKALDVASDDDPELELEQDSASQGEEVDAEITNVEDGDTYYVAVRADDRRDENTDAGNFTNPFVNAGDTEDTGLVNGNYFAEVEADGTSGLTRLDTEFLDDTSIDVYLYGDGTPGAAGVVGDTDFEQDDVSLDVSQAQITIDSPGQTYVPGQEVDLNGTVSEGVEEVSIFVRDRDRYYHVQNISVDDDDGTYDEEDFELSSESATQEAQDIVGQPGVYRYGVIDIQDVFAAANDDETDTEQPFVGGSDGGLTSSDFSSGASNQQSLRVAEPSLEATIETYAGEVYQDDDVDITGTLIGPREYVVLFTDSRGDTVVNTFNADSDDGEIDEEDITLDGLATGDIRASVLSPGRDVEFGDGVLSVSQDTVDDAEANGFLTTPPNREAPIEGTVDNFVGIARAVGVRDNTQTQVTEILLSETVEESGSDDLIVAEEFRLRDDSSTQIEDVVPEQIAENATGITGIEVGETMVVRGMTNRNPDDATIVVEATEGPSIAELGTAVTDEWGYDGVWNVSIEVPEDVEPGQYTIQSDDGDRISEANVTIAAEGTYEEGERAGNQLGELQNQIEELQTQVDNLESERDELEQQVSDLESENSDLESQLEEAQSQSDTGGNDTQDNGTDDGQGQPGFTAVAALISLIAVALLAIRRQEE